MTQATRRQRTYATVEVRCGYCYAPKTARASEYARYGVAYCDKSCATRGSAGKIPTIEGRCCTPLKDKPTPRTFIGVRCMECGTTFVAKSAKRPLCSPCVARISKRIGKDKRRAMKRNAHVERIYRRKVYERDEWTCRICGEAVDRDAVVPHPRAPTLDHILPLALGGRHEYTNVQTAHFLCNSTKGARVTQLSFAA